MRDLYCRWKWLIRCFVFGHSVKDSVIGWNTMLEQVWRKTAKCRLAKEASERAIFVINHLAARYEDASILTPKFRTKGQNLGQRIFEWSEHRSVVVVVIGRLLIDCCSHGTKFENLACKGLARVKSLKMNEYDDEVANRHKHTTLQCRRNSAYVILWKAVILMNCKMRVWFCVENSKILTLFVISFFTVVGEISYWLINFQNHDCFDY